MDDLWEFKVCFNIYGSCEKGYEVDTGTIISEKNNYIFGWQFHNT